MPTTFEQSIAALVENRMGLEHKELAEFRKGFVLLDSDEQAKKAFGLYRFQIGSVPALMPVVYRDGELDGLDILILRELGLFIPATESWINLISDSGERELGDLVEDSGIAKGPSQITLELRDFPHMVRTAEAELPEDEAAIVRDLVHGSCDLEVVKKAISESAVETWLTAYPIGAAMVAKAAEADPGLAERLATRHGDGFVDAMRGKVPEVCEQFDVLQRKASVDAAETPAQIHVITDIGDPAARDLRASEKRILLKTGQFIVDKRAAAETTVVMRSPDSGAFQTCPGAGRWQMLTDNGDLIEIETYLPLDDDRKKSKPAYAEHGPNLWVVPMDGSRPFHIEGSELFVRPSKIAKTDRPDVGMTLTRENLYQAVQDARKESEDMYGDNVKCADSDPDRPERLHGDILFFCRGRAIKRSVWLPRREDKKTPITCGGKTLIINEGPGRLRLQDDRIVGTGDVLVIGTNASCYSEPSLRPGRPEDIKKKVLEADDSTVELNATLGQFDGLVSLEGAINRKACSENMALSELIGTAGIHAATATSMVKNLKARPGVRHSYILRKAAVDPEADALAAMKVSIPQKTARHISPELLRETGKSMAGKLSDVPDDSLDEGVIQQVLSMSDFRDIGMDSIRQFTGSMNEAGKMLLRILVHRGRYEERYGDDVEQLETSVRKAFIENGSLALFLREKRGKGGESSGEVLAGLITDDMG